MDCLDESPMSSVEWKDDVTDHNTGGKNFLVSCNTRNLSSRPKGEILYLPASIRFLTPFEMTNWARNFSYTTLVSASVYSRLSCPGPARLPRG